MDQKQARSFEGEVVMKGENIPNTEDVHETIELEDEVKMYDWISDTINGYLGKRIRIKIEFEEVTCNWCLGNHSSQWCFNKRVNEWKEMAKNGIDIRKNVVIACVGWEHTCQTHQVCRAIAELTKEGFYGVVENGTG